MQGYAEHPESPEPRESGLYLLDQELDRMDKLIARAESDLAAILMRPRLDMVSQDTPTPETAFRGRVERLRAQCSSWDRLLNRADV